MARSIRIQYPGAYYHVMARGNRREAIFLDDDDRRFFLQAVGEGLRDDGLAGACVGAHEQSLSSGAGDPAANLVDGMQWLQNTFTRRFNVRHRKWGRLFGDRDKAVLTEGGSGYHYETLLDYLHLNPVRGGLIRLEAGQSVRDYPWSSVAGGYALPGRRRASWFVAEAGLAAFQSADTTSGRQQFVARLDAQARAEGARQAGVPAAEAEADARSSHLRRGWYWGTQAFAEKMLALAKGAMSLPKGRAYRSGGVRRTHDERQAQQWIAEGLVAAGLRKEELAGLPGSDSRKVALARLLWQRTTVSQQWIAERLQMRSAANVSQQLRRQSRREAKLPKTLRLFLKEEKLSRIEP